MLSTNSAYANQQTGISPEPGEPHAGSADSEDQRCKKSSSSCLNAGGPPFQQKIGELVIDGRIALHRRNHFPNAEDSGTRRAYDTLDLVLQGR